MFDKIYVQKTDTTQISNAIKRAADITSEAQTKAVDKLVASKDRVDISLNEYKRFLNLETQIKQYERILKSLGIPFELNIDTDSIHVSYCDNPRDFKRKYRIEFDVDERYIS